MSIRFEIRSFKFRVILRKMFGFTEDFFAEGEQFLRSSAVRERG